MSEEKKGLLRQLSELVVPWDTGRDMPSTGYWGGFGANSGDIFSEWGTTTDGITSNYDAYRKIALVRNCIKLLSHFSTRNGFITEVEGPSIAVCEKIKTKVDSINRKVNMDGVLYQAIMVREIWGCSAYMVITDKSSKLPVSLYPLNPSLIKVVRDPKTLMITGYVYHKDGKPEPLKLNQALFFPLDVIDAAMIGDSSVSTIRSAIKRKCNLSEDMLQAAKRCWAPFGIFKVETQKGKAEEQIKKFRDEIKPGMSIVTNLNVDGKIYDMKPDLNGLVRAEEKVDEEIMGNWQMPKALLSREKTMTKATLEFSLHALYAGPVAGVQRFMKRELERQFYDNIVTQMGHDPEVYRVKHVWNPMVLADASLIRALTDAVAKGVLTQVQMFDILGWKGMKPEGVLVPEKKKAVPTKDETDDETDSDTEEEAP
jgi:hypothetical protein